MVRGESPASGTLEGLCRQSLAPCNQERGGRAEGHDALEWFKGTGKGYQTLMNNVLRAFVQSRSGFSG